MELDLALVWKELRKMQACRVVSLHAEAEQAVSRIQSLGALTAAAPTTAVASSEGSASPPLAAAGATAAVEAYENRISQLEQKLHSDAVQVFEQAIARQSKRQEGSLAAFQKQLKQYCVGIFKEEHETRSEMNSALQKQLDALHDKLEESLLKTKSNMATVQEHADQELLARLEEAVERETAAREEADAELLRTTRELLLEEGQRLQESLKCFEDRLESRMTCREQPQARAAAAATGPTLLAAGGGVGAASSMAKSRTGVLEKVTRQSSQAGKPMAGG